LGGFLVSVCTAHYCYGQSSVFMPMSRFWNSWQTFDKKAVVVFTHGSLFIQLTD